MQKWKKAHQKNNEKKSKSKKNLNSHKALNFIRKNISNNKIRVKIRKNTNELQKYYDKKRNSIDVMCNKH